MSLKATVEPYYTSGSPVTLADSAAPSGMHNLSMDGQRKIDEEELPGAAYKSLFDRGNRIKSVSFDVWEPFGTAQAAFSAAHARDDSLPGICTLKLIISDTGATTDTYTYSGAALLGVQMVKWLGGTAWFRYSFKCAGYTKTTV